MAKHKFGQGNQFAKGHGRPKGSSYVSICQEWAEKRGWKQLMDWADGKTTDKRELQFDATKTLIEYGYGKPRQAVDVSGNMEVNIVNVVQEARRARGLET